MLLFSHWRENVFAKLFLINFLTIIVETEAVLFKKTWFLPWIYFLQLVFWWFASVEAEV